MSDNDNTILYNYFTPNITITTRGDRVINVECDWGGSYQTTHDEDGEDIGNDEDTPGARAAVSYADNVLWDLVFWPRVDPKTIKKAIADLDELL